MIQDIRLKYTTDELFNLIDRFTETRVLVVGDIILDEYVWGDVSRISPEAPVPVVEIKEETKSLGGAANVVHNIISLGGRSCLCGVTGDDGPGRSIIETISGLGVKTNGIVADPSRKTSVKTRVVARNQQVVRFDRETRKPVAPDITGKMIEIIKKELKDINAIIVADYGKGTITPLMMSELRNLVADSNIILAVDPKPVNFEHYRGIDVITPNHHEAGAFVRFEISDEETLIRAGEIMLKELECRAVLITQGKDGMTLFESGLKPCHIPTVARKVFDVSGAGDTVIGALSLALASGMDRKSAAVISNYAAGIVVGEVGTSVVTADELKEAIRDGIKA